MTQPSHSIPITLQEAAAIMGRAGKGVITSKKSASSRQNAMKASQAAAQARLKAKGKA